MSKRHLGSGRKMCEAGNRLVFDDHGSYVENNDTGERTALTKDKGSYIFTVWSPTETHSSKTTKGTPAPTKGTNKKFPGRDSEYRIQIL